MINNRIQNKRRWKEYMAEARYLPGTGAGLVYTIKGVATGKKAKKIKKLDKSDKLDILDKTICVHPKECTHR